MACSPFSRGGRVVSPVRTASELLSDFRAGRSTPSGALSATRQQIERTNGQVNALCALNPGAEMAAHESDLRYRRGAAIRPLEGIPFVVKDIIHTEGLKTTFGSKVYETFIPRESSIAVSRLIEAGAVLVGKSNTPEFAHDVLTSNRLFGPTRNPADLAYTSGGSSGGTAAAIAAGMVPVGLGTDLGGSIRVPAAMCGVLGLRPSPGRVPVYPNDFGWDTLVSHVHGPMARSIEDVGLLMSVLAGPDERDPSSLPSQPIDYRHASSGKASVQGRRIAFSVDLNGALPVEAEIAELTASAVRSFEKSGVSVENGCFDVSDLLEIIAGTRGFGMVGRYARLLRDHREQLGNPLIRQVEDALSLDVQAVTDAERARTRYWHRFRTFMEDYDYLVTPVIGTTAWRLDRGPVTEINGKALPNSHDPFRFPYAFSILGVPVLAVPAGRTSAGLPVGLQIVGRRFGEAELLEAGAAYMAMHQDWVTPPL